MFIQVYIYRISGLCNAVFGRPKETSLGTPYFFCEGEYHIADVNNPIQEEGLRFDQFPSRGKLFGFD